MQIAILGLLIIGLGVQAFYLKNQSKSPGFKSFSEPYKNRLVKFPKFFILGILALGSVIAICGITGYNPIKEIRNANIPTDLQNRKEAAMQQLDELRSREKTVSGNLEYKRLIADYSSLKNEIISYTSEANSRGLNKNNDILIQEIDEKLIGFKNSITSTETRTDKCNICGRTFSGDGYSESNDGVWRPCKYPYSSSICSAECGIKSTGQFNRAADNLINSGSSSLCSNCGLGHYQNGFCNRCGAASAERVNQSRSKSADCPMCKGTGIEKPMDANSSGESGRICPTCGGTGKQSY